MKTKKFNKRGVIALLIVLLIALGVGFAAFSDTLTISGTANAKGSFDVVFTSVSLDTTNSVGVDTVNSSASVVDGNTITLNAANLESGSTTQAVFTVNVHNLSTTTAKLNGINIAYNGSDASDDLFNVTTSLVSGSTLAPDDNAAGGTDEATFTVTITLKDNC